MSKIISDFNGILPFPWPIDDPEKIYNGNNTILDLIVSAGDAYAPYATKAIEMGADPCAKQDGIWSPLLSAAASGRVGILKAMVEAVGYNVIDAIIGDTLTIATLMRAAISYGRPNVVEYLIAVGANVNGLKNWQSSYLELAADMGNVVIVDMLVRAGADVAKREKETGVSLLSGILSRSPFSDAESRITRILLDAGADPNGFTFTKNAVLSQLARENGIDAARLLLEAGADPNIETNKDFPPLHFAIRSLFPSMDMVRLLLDYGAHPDGSLASPGSLMCRAVLEDKEGEISTLIAAGAKVEIFSEAYNNTPLGLSAIKGNLQVMRALLDAGADINGNDQSLNSPLHMAVSYKNLDAVCFLLERGADVLKLDALGQTPLAMMTLMHGALDGKIIEVLLKAGADPFAKDRNDLSPYDRVLQTYNGDSQKTDCLKILNQFEAVKNQPVKRKPPPDASFDI